MSSYISSREPTTRLRFVKRQQEDRSIKTILQQCWLYKEYTDNIYGPRVTEKWEDMPVEEETP